MIEPSDIDSTKHFWDAFDHAETEVSARYIVRLCQEVGGWVPFTFEQINAFYQKARGNKIESFTFNRLVDAQWVRTRPWAEPELKGGGWVFRDHAGNYHISEEFIKRCANSSPAKKDKQ